MPGCSARPRLCVSANSRARVRAFLERDDVEFAGIEAEHLTAALRQSLANAAAVST